MEVVYGAHPHTQVGMNVAPCGSAAVHVEASVLINDAPEGGGELLSEAGIESRFPHKYESAIIRSIPSY